MSEQKNTKTENVTVVEGEVVDEKTPFFARIRKNQKVRTAGKFLGAAAAGALSAAVLMTLSGRDEEEELEDDETDDSIDVKILADAVAAEEPESE